MGVSKCSSWGYVEKINVNFRLQDVKILAIASNLLHKAAVIGKLSQ